MESTSRTRKGPPLPSSSPRSIRHGAESDAPEAIPDLSLARPGHLLRLQALAGNRAVASAVATTTSGPRPVVQRDPALIAAQALTATAKAALTAQQKAMGDFLQPSEADLAEVTEFRDLKAERDRCAKGTVAYEEKWAALMDFGRAWMAARLTHKNAQVARLTEQVTKAQVPGRHTAAFADQAKAKMVPVRNARSAGEAAAEATFTASLGALISLHQRVADVEAATGAQFGAAPVRASLASVEAAIRAPAVSGDTVETKVKALEDLVMGTVPRGGVVREGGLKTKVRENMRQGQKYAAVIEGHSDATAAGAKEGASEAAVKELKNERAAFKAAKAALAKVRGEVTLSGEAISGDSAESLKTHAELLASFADREKEAKALVLREKYRVAPFYLEPGVLEMVHADRHVHGTVTAHKTADRIEDDYLGECKNQWDMKSAVWLNHLGYSGDALGAKVRQSGTSFTPTGGDPVPGHHTVYVSPNEDLRMARSAAKAPPNLETRDAAYVMNIVYPSKGVEGAHYSLELGGAYAAGKPAAFRGGATKGIAGFAEVDRTDARNHLVAQQAAEEARVQGLIQAAIADHMHSLSKTKPPGPAWYQRRIKGAKPAHLS